MGVKYKVNEKFFKHWTEEMAYVLGYVYADGSLEKADYIRGRYLRVSSTDRDTIVKIKQWLGSEHTIALQQPKTANSKVRYLLRIGSHKLYESLVHLGLYPNKSLSIILPKIPKRYFRHFVRGYFDGDGCVRIDMKKGKRGQQIINKLSTVFTSGSEQFLQQLAEGISRYVFTDQLKVYKGHRSFMLSYSTGDSIKLFQWMYVKVRQKTYLQRKADVYFQYFKLKPEKLDRKVKNVLHCLR